MENITATILIIFILQQAELQIIHAQNTSIRFTVSTTEIVGKNHQFWKAAGSDFLFKIINEPEGIHFLNQAETDQTVKYYRTHYTFSDTTGVDKRAGGMVGGRVMTVDKDGHYRYDFSKVNKAFKELATRGLKPIVEFDFYPTALIPQLNKSDANSEGFQGSKNGPTDWKEWENLLNRFMQNLVKEFGIEELKTWYFEVWNEPDSWPQKNLSEFFHIYDLFAFTVKKYDPGLKIGGPGCYTINFMKLFLDHITDDTNCVTRQKGSPVDFLSYHIYGLSGSWLEKAGPVWLPQVSKFSADILWMQRLLNNYPSLKNVEFHINEWGLCSHGDSKFSDKFPMLEYRNSEVSALFMVKLVHSIYAIEENYKFKTSMLLYWGSWFNAATGPIFSGSRDLMTSGNVPKPIYIAFEMLAKLGENRLKVIGPPVGGRFGMLATRSEKQIQLLVYNFDEQDDLFDKKDAIIINLEGLTNTKSVSISEIWLDRSHHNTYRKWEAMGKPAFSENIISTLKEESVLTPDFSYTKPVHEGNIDISGNIPRHSMKLYLIDF